mmetsp:Transcript_10590/g.22069  ORF Transcript_10590/g.22069 Transcript_10590/m.22069 type:complete len:254 (-) Transcript_10590:9-770(-)
MSQHALLHKDMPTNRNYKNQHNHQTNSCWNASTTQGNAPTISKRLPLSLPPSISSALRGQSAGKPIQAFVQTIASGCACGLDEPLAMTKVVKAKLLSHFCRGHCLWQVLLVGKNQQHCITHLVLIQHLSEFLPGILNAITVIAVNDIDQSVGALVVVAPQRANLVLASHVPHGEGQVLVLHSLHVETNSWNSSHNFTQLQLVQDGRLTCGIQTHHQDSHLLLADHALPYLGESKTHCVPLRLTTDTRKIANCS